jgi:hypothetical protein
MIKLIFWGVIASIVYLYFSKTGLGQGESKNDVLDDEDYTIVKVPKKKKSESDEDNFSDYEEV